MKGELLAKLLEILEKLLTEKSFNNKFVVIFGANAPGTVMINYLSRKDVTIGAVVDNNKLLQGKAFLELKIESPETVLSKFKEDAFILIASKYYEEMKQQLEKMGYIEGKHIFQAVDMNFSVKYDLSIETFNESKNRVLKGLEVFNRIEEKYGESLIIMSPVRPNGDVYMICSYLRAYTDKINNQQSLNIVLTVIGESCYSTAQLFDFNNIVKLTWDESNYLAAFANFLPEKIKVINPYFSHLELFNYVDGYKGITFLDDVKYGLLGLSENDSVIKPKKERRKEIVTKLFEEYELEESNTVIFAPYANSIPQIKWSVWEELAVELKKLDYVVCTNCGTKDEAPVKGTKPVYFSFEDAAEFTERAGYVVSYRSGFCEIIADSKCKKIVIYPDHNIGLINLRNFFGMDNEIYRQENLVQIEHTFEKTTDLVNEILKGF